MVAWGPAEGAMLFNGVYNNLKEDYHYYIIRCRLPSGCGIAGSLSSSTAFRDGTRLTFIAGLYSTLNTSIAIFYELTALLVGPV